MLCGCGGSISDLFPVVAEVRQGCVLAPTLFSACMDWILERISKRSSGASLGISRLLTLISQMIQSSLQRCWISIWGVLQVQKEEFEPLRLRVSLVKTKIQAFKNIKDATSLSVPVCDEDVEVTKRLT